jgi:3-hydroxybutyryl-CoA dehydrogenase
VQEGLAAPADVDAIFKGCFGHKMGPLETADLIGIDTVVDSLDVLHQMFEDSKYQACSLLRKMVEEGHVGRKTGKGFYTY